LIERQVREFVHSRSDVPHDSDAAEAWIAGLEMAGSWWTLYQAMRRPAGQRNRGCLACIAISFVVGMLYVFTAPGGQFNFFWSLILLFVVGIGMMVYFRIRANRIWPDGCEDARCPACGYDMLGYSIQLPDSVLNGVRLGPDCCPECGRVWPLMP